MAERQAEGGGAFPLNLNTLLALLTLVGSVWLVSQKLTSTRPAASAGKVRDFVSEQTLEARLWEDPFKTLERQGKDDASPPLAALRLQIETRVHQPQGVLILAVMLQGGPYSENQESRIRSRFAIVSALGQSGYTPEDADHIGAVTLPWPTRQGLNQVKQHAQDNPQQSLTALWPQDTTLSSVNDTSAPLDLRYEW